MPASARVFKNPLLLGFWCCMRTLGPKTAATFTTRHKKTFTASAVESLIPEPYGTHVVRAPYYNVLIGMLGRNWHCFGWQVRAALAAPNTRGSFP